LVFIENLKEISKNHDFNNAPVAQISGGATSKKNPIKIDLQGNLIKALPINDINVISCFFPLFWASLVWRGSNQYFNKKISFIFFFVFFSFFEFWINSRICFPTIYELACGFLASPFRFSL
jgi:hypothetical protein